jgi:hypothetical protein
MYRAFFISMRLSDTQIRSSAFFCFAEPVSSVAVPAPASIAIIFGLNRLETDLSQ